MEKYLLIGIIWVALGIHSAWFLVKRYALYWDFTRKEIAMLVVCILLPIVSHIATMISYPNTKEGKIMFKKRGEGNGA